MNKILVADNIEMNKSILREIFSTQYEMIETDCSELAFRFITQYRNNISIILINESIARNFNKDMVRTLNDLKIFKKIPVIIILNGDSAHRARTLNLELPYSDVAASPVNPHIIRSRVGNLIELYSHKNELEELVERQTDKILSQNKALKLQQRKINTINNDMLDTLSTVIEYRDVESGRHIHRIKKFTEVMLKVLAVKYPKYNMTEERINLISSASALHDIGKIAIPDSILLSPRRLTYEEFNIMKAHTVKGCDLLNQLDSVERNEYFTYCYDICRYHHEKFDGKGYPDGLVGHQIPIWAQVVSVADCYDALTSERPYKAAFSHDQAVEMIRTGACGAFSDEMMDCFGEVINEFKNLAKEYADINHADSSVSNGSERKLTEEEQDTADYLYRKMNRDDLIRTIEKQKVEMLEARRRDNEILNKVSDFVFAFDMEKDSSEEYKGEFNALFGYVPKNYSEAAILFAQLCPDEYHSKVSRTLRYENLVSEINNNHEKVVLECPMRIDGNIYSSVRLTVVPMTENDEIKHIYVSLQRLVYNTCDEESEDIRTDRDPMTGLWNFSGLRSETDDYLEHTGKNGRHMLMLIDIDGFRTINRQTGYRFGNEILKDIAQVLSSQFADNNIIGRIEDDNFIVVLKDCAGREENLTLVDSLFRSLHKTYTFNGKTYPEISACIGVADYPANGRNFEELFFNASKAVDIAKINGKNMYLFYNSNMRTNWEIRPVENEALVQTGKNNVIRFESCFDPIVDSVNEKVVSYEIMERSDEYGSDFNFDEIYSALYKSGNVTAFSLDSLRRIFSVIYTMETQGLDLPGISVMTMFKGADSEIIMRAIEEIVTYCPVNCRNICINIPQEMLKDMDMRQMKEFVDFLSGFGFETGVYNVGLESINIKCFSKRMFGRVTFANSFLDEIGEGVIPVEIAVYLIDCFTGLGMKTYMPIDADEDVVRQIRNKTDVVFGIHSKDIMNEELFRENIKTGKRNPEIPILGHEKTSLVLSEKIYDEILEQTKSFIFEWNPRLDSVKFSGSFEKMYGYMPALYDFVKNIRNTSLLHSDDIRKFLEKLNFARSEGADAECLIRIYNVKTDDYVWNRAHFVAVRNAAGVPVKIMAVCADVSGEGQSDETRDSRRDRTDFITNLYNRSATENKIRNYLFDEGAASIHTLVIAEICNFDKMEQALGKAFANAVLKETADNIRELFRDSDIIGRISGAQFVIFIKGMSSIEKITQKCEDICSVIKHKYETNEGEISIFGKLGVSLYPSGGRSYEELYSSALKSLYYAKHNITSDIVLDSGSSDIKRLN